MNASPSIRLTPPQSPFSRSHTCLVPGSKSYTIRALLIAALTPGVVTLTNPLDSDDTQAMKACLRALGIEVTESVQNDIEQWTVQGSIHDVKPGNTTLHCNLSAASLRFLIALSTILPGEQTLQGEHGLNQRPVKDLVDSLQALGAEIDYVEREGYPPVRVKSSSLNDTGTVQVSAKTSSQYTSALMMIAPELAKRSGQSIRIALNEQPISQPYLEMTRAIMEDFGVTVTSTDSRHYEIAAGQSYNLTRYAVETDASGMAYFLAIAALTKSSLTIANVNPDSVQADMALIKILERMGNRFSFENGNLIIDGQGVKALNEIDMEDCPDQAQTVAVLAAFANGATRLVGLQSLRVKETDRLSAVATELQKMGIDVVETADTLTIHGGNPKAASIATYGDHRMAMSFAVAGSILNDLIIEDPAVVNKTFPTFWNELQKLGIGIKPLPCCGGVPA